MKRGLILAFFIVFFISINISNAEIIVSGPQEANTNIGDEITISGYVLREEDTLGLLKFELNCNNDKSILLIKSISLKKGIKKDFNEVLAITSFLEGSCYVNVALEQQGTTLESKKSASFSITKALTGSFTIDKDNLQVGDELKITGTSYKQNSNPVEGFCVISLKKEGNVYFTDSCTIKKGNVNYNLKTTELPGGEYNVEVEVRDSFGNNAIFEAGKFVLISKITVTAHTEKGHYLPKEKVKVSGTAEILSGNLKKGNAYLTINEETYEETVKSGAFEISFALDSKIKSGKHDISISIEDEFGAIGLYEFSIIIDPIPTDIGMVISKEAINPGEKITVKAFLNDQAGDLIEEEILITIEDKKGKEYYKSIKKSGEQFDITIDDIIDPGNYFLRATYSDIKSEKAFLVGQVEGLSYEIEGQLLIIKNIGNIIYEAPIHIKLKSDEESKTIIEDLKLTPSSIEKIDLGAGIPSGIYTATIDEVTFENINIEHVRKIGYEWLVYITIAILLILLWWLFIKLKKVTIKRKIKKTIKKHNIRGKKGELYGGAPLSVKSDEEHVRKFKNYMQSAVSRKKKPLRFSLKKKKTDDYSYIPTKKGSIVRDKSTIRKDSYSDVFSGALTGWTRKEETTYKKKKKDDDSSEGLFNMFG